MSHHDNIHITLRSPRNGQPKAFGRLRTPLRQAITCSCYNDRPFSRDRRHSGEAAFKDIQKTFCVECIHANVCHFSASVRVWVTQTVKSVEVVPAAVIKRKLVPIESTS